MFYGLASKIHMSKRSPSKSVRSNDFNISSNLGSKLSPEIHQNMVQVISGTFSIYFNHFQPTRLGTVQHCRCILDMRNGTPHEVLRLWLFVLKHSKNLAFGIIISKAMPVKHRKSCEKHYPHFPLQLPGHSFTRR